MSEERITLFDLDPDKFIMPGESKNGAQPVPDLVFERDKCVPGLYRAKIEAEDVSWQGNGFHINEAAEEH